jgi:hypothetical protein
MRGRIYNNFIFGTVGYGMWDRFAPCKHEGFQLSDALGTLGEYAGLDVKAYFNS